MTSASDFTLMAPRIKVYVSHMRHRMGYIPDRLSSGVFGDMSIAVLPADSGDYVVCVHRTSAGDIGVYAPDLTEFILSRRITVRRMNGRYRFIEPSAVQGLSQASVPLRFHLDMTGYMMVRPIKNFYGRVEDLIALRFMIDGYRVS